MLHPLRIPAPTHSGWYTFCYYWVCLHKFAPLLRHKRILGVQITKQLMPFRAHTTPSTSLMLIALITKVIADIFQSYLGCAQPGSTSCPPAVSCLSYVLAHLASSQRHPDVGLTVRLSNVGTDSYDVYFFRPCVHALHFHKDYWCDAETRFARHAWLTKRTKAGDSICSCSFERHS